ncbi:MAG: hypothetical protein ACJ8GN_19085 [Longimicrobiaceae bacterium]
MSPTAYYLLCLSAGLAIIAMASAWIARHLRWRVLRRLKAADALDALARYCHWVASQRRATFFQEHCHECDAPLDELRAALRQCFPELGGEAAELLGAHSRLIDYLWSQQLLRLRDPEAWLELDHEAGFALRWEQHLGAAEALAQRLRLAGELQPNGALPYRSAAKSVLLGGN